MAPTDANTQTVAVVHIRLLGGFRAERNGTPIAATAWQRRQARNLVKLLAAYPGHRLHREQIEDLLWPDAAPGTAAAQLRKALHFARHALEPDLPPRQQSSCIHLVDDLITLDTTRCDVDADTFQHAASDALTTRDLDALDHALSLYTGDLLPEDRYEDWTIPHRDTLTNLHRALLQELSVAHEQLGHHAAAAQPLHQLLLDDPAQEELHRRLMRLAAAAGSRHDAIRHYQACRTALRDELGTEPGPETDALYQQILAGRLRADPPPQHILPAAVRRQPTTPLVGRDEILAELDHDARRAAGGSGRTILLSGEMGVGKSRLIAELARRQHRAGTLVLWGATGDLEAQMPYAPVADALDGYLTGLTASARATLSSDHPDLAALLPSLGHTSPVQPWLVPNQRPQLFAEIVRFLASIAGDQPLLLVLDDLHAAHDSTIDLLQHLAHAASSRRWLIVGIYRYDLTITGNVRHLPATIARNGLGRHIDLLRLTRDECSLLLSGLLDGGVVSQTLLDEVYTWSLGNALFASVISREMMDHGTVIRDGDTWITTPGDANRVPRQIRDLIDARVHHLSDHAQRILSLAATTGYACSYALLHQSAGLSENDLLDALDLAIDAHIIDEQDDGYIFAHPIFRESLYAGLPRHRRVRLHATIATAIESLGVDPERDHTGAVEALAFHLVRAGEPRRALPWMILAADHATRLYATSDAIDQLERALALTQDPAFPADEANTHRAAIGQRLATLHALAGNAARACDTCAIALDAGALTTLEAAAMHQLATRQYCTQGKLTDAEQHLAAAWRLLDIAGPDDATRRTRLDVTLASAQLHVLSSRFEQAMRDAETSVRLAREIGSEADIAQALEMVSMTCLPLGQWKRGLDHERQHAGLVDLNRFVRDVADVHFCFADFHVYASEPAEAARTFERALAESERLGAPRSVAMCHYYLGVMDYFHGQFGEALSHLTDAISGYQQVESPLGEAISRMVRGVSKTAIGQLDAGQQDLLRGIEIANTGSMRSHALTRLYAGMCRNRLDANDAEGARFYAESGLRLTDEPTTCICFASFLPGAAAAFAVSGDLDRATQLSQQALDVNQQFGSPAFHCMAWQSAAMVHALTGDWAAALDALEQASQLATTHNFPYELARILLLRSFVHMQRRDRGDLATATRLMAEASPPLLRLGVRTSAAQLRSSIGFLVQHAG